jgi:energy-coupling factor transporter ATP-binding protein EcfA2
MCPQTNNSNTLFNPFPGLRPFTIAESHLFFGREGQSEEVLSNLSKNRFVAVVGSSGSGKSSLMYCGVVPILHGGFITEAGSKWKIIPSRPGNDPIGNLAKGIVEASNAEKGKKVNSKLIRAILNSNSQGLTEAIKHTQKKSDQNYLILADQFEELFRFRNKQDDVDAANEAFAYVRLILNAVQQSEVPIYVIMTMRSDFIGECAQYQELTELINTSHYLIPQMNRDNFRLAITGPVAVGGGRITDKLVNELLNDLGDNPDQLPILQHALMRTWNFWIEHTSGQEAMDVEHYEAIGRLEKALSNHANEAYNELSPDEKEICENMFKTLTERGNDNRGIRHPTSLDIIAKIASARERDVIKVIEHFREQGRSFLTSADLKLESTSIIDISHESLMRIWDKLKVWVEEEAIAIQMYMRLSEAAAMYQEGKIGLWRPPDLQLALNWRKEKKPTLTWAQRFSPAFERAMVYLETSEKAHLAEEENKIRLQKKALRRSRIFAIVLGTAAVISLGFMVYAITMQAESNKQRIIAEQQREEAEKQKKEADAQKELALQKEKEANEQRQLALDKEAEARRQSEIAERQRIYAEQSLAEAKRQEEIAMRQTTEAQKQKEIADKKSQEALEEKKKVEEAQEVTKQLRMLSIARSMAVKSVQIEENDELKALLAYQAYEFNEEYGGDIFNPDIFDGLYYALKEKNGPEFNSLRGHSDVVRSLFIAPGQNSELFSAGSDGTIFKWKFENDMMESEAIYSGEEIIREIAISPDGKLLAFANDLFQVKLMRLGADNDSTLYSHGNVITSVKFIDNQTLLSSSTDGSVFIRNVKNGNNEKIMEETAIMDAAVSPDGKEILYVTEANKAMVYSTDNKTKKEVYSGSKPLYSCTISHNGKIMVIGGKKGTITILNQDEEPKEINAHNSRINDLKFSNDDEILATVGFDGAVRLYFTENFDKTPIVIRDYSAWGISLAFSNLDDVLYTSYVDSNIKEWNVYSKDIANRLYPKIGRNMSQKEWETYVGKDIPYIETLEAYKK